MNIHGFLVLILNKKPKIHPITLQYIHDIFQIMSVTNSFLTKQQIKNIKQEYEQD